MSTKIIEVTGSQPLVTVDENVSNVSVVNQPIEITVSSAVAVGNATIRNALGAVDPIWYDKVNGVFGFIDRSEVVRAEKMADPANLPEYAGELTGELLLDAENFDIFVINVSGAITGIEFGNVSTGEPTMADGQTVTIIGTQSTSNPPGYIDQSSGNWANWFWINDNADLPQNAGDVFMIKVLWTGNTYYASLMEFNTLMPTTQVGIPVSDTPPENPDNGWLWYRYQAAEPDALMIYVDGDWVVAGGGGGASVHVGDTEPPDPQEGDLWYDTGTAINPLKIYYADTWVTANPGEQGDRGYTGSRGAIGFSGSRGFVGSIGFTGSKGDQGATGFDGSASTLPGPQGDTGFAGSQGFTGSSGAYAAVGFTGSRGDTGYTGSASTAPGPKGYTGSQGSTGPIGETGYSGSRGFAGSTGLTGSQGYTGSQGFMGSAGFNGSIGFTGSQGDEGAKGDPLKIIDNVPTVADLPDPYFGTFNDVYIVDENGHAYMNQGLNPALWNDIGQWVGYTGSQGFNGSVGFTGSQGFTGSEGPKGDKGDPGTGGGEWDGILYDKPAVIQQPTGSSDFNNTNSGIQIGKNGFDTDDSTPIPVEVDQHNNLVVGRNSYIKGGAKNVTLFGSNLRVGDIINPEDNTAIFGNRDTKTFYLGESLIAEDDSIDKYGSTYDVLKLSPAATNKDLVITTPGSIILANNTGDPDQGIQINASRLRYRGSLLPNSENADASSIRREIYFDSTNILSSALDVEVVATEDNELSQVTKTWRRRRQLNYISPERIRFRKFAECVNYQEPGDLSLAFPDQTYAGPDMDIDLHRGTIQHKVMTDNVININITDVEWTSGTTLRTMGHEDHQPEPGTSITIILYHSDTIKTITWPSNFKFLGGDSALTTQAGSATTENINGTDVNNIVAIDILHAFYDGNTWWSSITRGYA